MQIITSTTYEILAFVDGEANLDVVLEGLGLESADVEVVEVPSDQESLVKTNQRSIVDGRLVIGDPLPETSAEDPVVEADQELRSAIQAASSLEQLKAALLGSSGRPGAAARPEPRNQ